MESLLNYQYWLPYTINMYDLRIKLITDSKLSRYTGVPAKAVMLRDTFHDDIYKRLYEAEIILALLPRGIKVPFHF